MEISKKLRVGQAGYAHWCPGCDELHILPTNRGWTYTNVGDRMTATPSFKHSWSGLRNGERRDEICHYILTDGVLNFCGDCSHGLKGQSVPLPDLPEDYRDFEEPIQIGPNP